MIFCYTFATKKIAMIEYFSSNLWILWLIIAIVCMIVELTSFDFYVTCVAVGAIGGMLGALVGLPLWLQIILWAVVAIASIRFIRPLLTRHLHKSSRERSSNADALIGQQGTVTQTIASEGYGYVKIAGDEWRAIAADEAEIAVGTKVVVVARESTIITVAPR